MASSSGWNNDKGFSSASKKQKTSSIGGFVANCPRDVITSPSKTAQKRPTTWFDHVVGRF